MKPSITDIDAVLPQTQCGDCGYGGCMPYATAMAQGEADINLCPPGGQRTLKKLASLFNKNSAAYELAAKPKHIAVIDEALCIGCTKCIQACPVDAISGAAKLMHTVIASECTGCNLCVEPCPMDCIIMEPIQQILDEATLDAQANHARARFVARNERLQQDELLHHNQHQQAKHTAANSDADAKKSAIAAAVARAKAKRATGHDAPKTP